VPAGKPAAIPHLTKRFRMHNQHYPIRFSPRWKEELVAQSPDGCLVFMFTWGRNHIYFPDEEKWQSCVPAWALDKWALYREQCAAWCARNQVPMTVTDHTFVYAENADPGPGLMGS
jgi:hypothetical protein